MSAIRDDVAEIQTLAVAVQGALDRVSQTLARRIRLLADRYAIAMSSENLTVPALNCRIELHTSNSARLSE